FPAVDWVVQLDCPEDAHTYIHRVGRTARYQLGGESLLVLLPSEEQGMVEQMSDTKIPITKIKINPNKLQNPVRKMEALLARDPNLKASAQRAFVTYAKSVFLMKNKQVFNVGALDTDAYSKSLGLALPPRIRFLRSLDKRQGQPPVVTDKEDSTADSSSEEDILCVKRWDHELTTEPEPEPVSKTSKAVSKAAVAVVNKGKDKLSELARQYELSEEAGLDVVAAKLVLREEDKFDKQLFRERVKEKHREEKRRLRKAAGREDDDKDEGVVLKDSAISGDDSSNEEHSDRDESSNEERDDSSNEERSERDDDSNEDQSKQDDGSNEESSRQDDNKAMEQFHRIIPSKRLSTPRTSEAKRRRRDMSLSLGEEEELALRLLGHD
ncbi:unnamed protein product, partial [Timema podura]|nr:unnamed protein product [Timema podura]